MWKLWTRNWTSRKSKDSKEAVKYFSPEKREQALKWLEDKWPEDRRECECCGSKDWTVAGHLVMAALFTGEFTIGGSVYPHILVICTNCGNSKLFNAIVAGIVEAKTGLEPASKDLQSNT